MAEMTIHQLTREDIAQHMDPNNLRVTQIIQFALTVGPVAFMAIVFLLKATAAPAEADEDSFTQMLLLALGPVAMSLYIAAAFMQRVMTAPQKLLASLPAQNSPGGWAGSLMARHRVLLIVRMSIYEAAAFFGLSIILLAVLDGSLGEQPILWLGLLPTAIHVAASVLTFPSRNGLAQFIHQKMVKPLQRM